jgi:hypothetical protein
MLENGDMILAHSDALGGITMIRCNIWIPYAFEELKNNVCYFLFFYFYIEQLTRLFFMFFFKNL